MGKKFTLPEIILEIVQEQERTMGVAIYTAADLTQIIKEVIEKNRRHGRSGYGTFIQISQGEYLNNPGVVVRYSLLKTIFYPI